MVGGGAGADEKKMNARMGSVVCENQGRKKTTKLYEGQAHQMADKRVCKRRSVSSCEWAEGTPMKCGPGNAPGKE